MKFNFRKIASTVASTVLIGSTVALAAAASYPAPFASGGVANVGIVYGSNAGSSDLVAATDIRINLENALVKMRVPKLIAIGHGRNEQKNLLKYMKNV